MSTVSAGSRAASLEPRGYNLFGYRFNFQTEDAGAARRLDALYSAFRDEPDPGQPTYELFRSECDTEHPQWSAYLPDGDVRTAPLLQDALYSVEVGICSEVMARPNRRHGIHGAVIHTPGGGVLISGVSGAGKTTLSLVLAAKGWQVAGDDAAFLDPGTYLVEAVPRNFHLDEHSVALLEAVGLRLPEEGWRYRFVTPADLGVVNPPPVRVRFVLLLELERGQQPIVQPQTQAEMTAALLMETGRGDFTDVEGVEALSGLIGRALCYRVRSGTLGETADAVMKLVNAYR